MADEEEDDKPVIDPDFAEAARQRYPSNTIQGKIDQDKELASLGPGKKKIKRIVHGKLLRKKKSAGSSFIKTFFGEDTKSVAQYILWDVLIPAAKNTIQEMVASGIEMLLFGEQGSGRRRERDRDRGHTNYGKYYRSGGVRDERETRHYAKPSNRYDFDEIIFENGKEASDVLNALEDLIEHYDVASVADFYELAGVEAQWTDEKWGWENLSRAHCVRVRHGYVIDLPRPVELELEN